MRKHRIAVLGLVLFLLAVTAPVFADGIKEGKWDLTMVTKMENMPPEMVAAMKQIQNMPPEQKAMMQQRMAQRGIIMSGNPADGMTVNVSRCLTNKNPFPKNDKMPQDCQDTHQINGNVVTFHTSCKVGEVQMESNGTITYNGDTMEGHIKAHESGSGREMDSTVDVTGKYAGPCS